MPQHPRRFGHFGGQEEKLDDAVEALTTDEVVASGGAITCHAPARTFAWC